jgi:hypothetical protein
MPSNVKRSQQGCSHLIGEVVVQEVIRRGLEEQVVGDSASEVARVGVPEAADSDQQGDDHRNRDVDRQRVADALYQYPACEFSCERGSLSSLMAV